MDAHNKEIIKHVKPYSTLTFDLLPPDYSFDPVPPDYNTT